MDILNHNLNLIPNLYSTVGDTDIETYYPGEGHFT